MKRILVIAIGTASLIGEPPAVAEKSDWAEGLPGQNDGANREHYNRAATLPWKHFLGDWRDAADTQQGQAPYAVAAVRDDDSQKPVEWDVTALVSEWMEGKFPNQGMFLRVVEDRGTIVFASRETGDANLRPRLVLTTADKDVRLEPVADTFLTKSTYRSQGHAEELRVSAAPDHLLIRFELGEAVKRGAVSRAKLVLLSTRQYGPATIGVFRCRQGHHEPPSNPVQGIAAHHPNDAGIGDDPDVLFATGFESPKWRDEWTQAEPKDKIDIVDGDSGAQRFRALQGKALRARIAKGTNTALNTLFKFADETGSEPQEIYFRYYLRLADDWNQTVQGGKLPGISGTYGRAGWGGRKSDGTNGWSARGLFKMTIPTGNPLGGTTPIGYYCYHADMTSPYGTNWVWQRDYRGYLERNRWYAIEQYCRLNTPGKKNGILRAWIDGRPAFEKTDIRFRLTDELRIEQIWLNLYHGGTKPSPHDQHAFIDNVVIARKYIGPITQATAR